MTDNSFDVLPEGVTRSLLKEFGLPWPQFTLLSGVFVSELSLEKYVDPGAWAVGVIVAFGVVYAFKRQVSGNFPRVAIATGISMLLASIPGAVVLARHSGDVTDALAGWRTWFTLYVALATCIPVAVAVLSHRKQERLYGGAYPKEIQTAIETCVVREAFYREDQVYEIEELAHVDGQVTFRVLLTYVVVNRTQTEQRYSAEYSAPSPDRVEYLRAEVDGAPLDIADRYYRTARGLVIPVTIPPGARRSILIEAQEALPDRASETFTAYLPTTAITLRLAVAGSELHYDCESLLPERVDPVLDGDVQTFSWSAGLLPFSGFRLYWHPIDVRTVHQPSHQPEVQASA